MGTKHASEKNKCVNSEIKKELKYLRQMKMKTQLSIIYWTLPN